jgi:AhpD family alkylhydroperoxidase
VNRYIAINRWRWASVDGKVRELVAVAASLAAGCSSCLEHHVGEAKRAGATPEEVQEALDVARAVRVTALTNMDSFATTVMSGEGTLAMAATRAGTCGPNCNC